MDKFQEREIVKQAYPNSTWYVRVQNMSDAQIHAVFLRLQSSGKVRV